MVLPAPTTLPVWAVQDQLDSVSNQNNVLTPPVQFQQFGWPRGEFPPRNWFNWLGRYTYQWLAYFKQNDSRSQTIITSATGNGSSSIDAICDNLIHPRGITMIYINDTQTGANATWAVYHYVRNSAFDNVPNLISNSGITVGTVTGATGVLNTISTTFGGTPIFNIVAVSYVSTLS